MCTKLDNPVQYELPIDNECISMNDLIGKYIDFTFLDEIYCIGCGRKTSRSFAQGYCFPCLQNAPETSECILRPELCQAHEGISRDMEWAEHHCLQPHFVYLAISSGLKVGVTRKDQIPTRWIDQGANYAIKLAETPNRYTAGLIEVILKKVVSDRTNWQRMLKNQIPENIDLFAEKIRLIEFLSPELQYYVSADDTIVDITYPVNEFPTKVKSVGFDKLNEISGRLWGIKGQYLMFDDGRVLNIRKHNGYNVTFEC
jgi:hypothetical protein